MNQNCKAHEIWLESAQRKFADAFKPLKDVFFEIIADALSRSTQISSRQSADQSSLMRENQILKLKCKELESECERYAKEFNDKLQIWTENFQTLKKRYRHLRHKLKESNSGTVNISDKSINKTDLGSKVKDEMINDEMMIMNYIGDVKSKRINNLDLESDSSREYSRLSPIKKDGEALNEKSNEFQRDKTSSNDSSYKQKNIDKDSKNSIHLSETEDQKNMIGVKINECQKNCYEETKSVRTGLELLKSKQKSKVTYRDKDASSINKKDISSTSALRAKRESLWKWKRPDAEEIADETTDRNSKQPRLVSPKLQVSPSKHDDVDQEQFSLSGMWKRDKIFGIPTLASTPAPKAAQEPSNIRDFDETIWSAPESPSVVSSIASPEKADQETKDERVFKLPMGFRKKKAQHTGKKSLSLFRNIHLQTPESSRDSTCHSRTDEWKNMTSIADLSDDMFDKNSTKSSKEEAVLDSRQLSGDKDSNDETFFEHDKVAAKRDIPKNNEGQESIAKYKYTEVVRKRRDRDKLDGFECAECAKWYEGDLDKVAHLKNVCRHKAVSSPPPATPRDFWSIGFPDTQEYIDKGYMLDENCSIPSHAQPRIRKEKASTLDKKSKS